MKNYKKLKYYSCCQKTCTSKDSGELKGISQKPDVETFTKVKTSQSSTHWNEDIWCK